MVPSNVIALTEMTEPKPIRAGKGHITPEFANVSLYLKKTEHAAIRKRADALGLSVSKYLLQLHRRDSGGGDFVIQPEKRRR